MPTGTDTWFQDCVGADPSTGTALEQSWFNRVIANLRSLFTQSGMTGAAGTGDDNMLRDGVALQTQAGQMSYAVDTGAVNAYAMTLSPVPLNVLGAGCTVRIKIAAGHDNTGASTLTVNGTTKPIKRLNGSDPPAGAIVGGGVYSFNADATNWYLLTGSVGSGPYSLGAIKTLTTSQTYNTPVGCRGLLVEIVGGGGGGAGCFSPNLNELVEGGGGGGGGYSRKMIIGPLSSYVVTIGAGGAAGPGSVANGGVGGTTSFGAACSATGGGGGTQTNSGNYIIGANGGGGGVGSGGDINGTGGIGGTGVRYSGANGNGGTGANTIYGGGGYGTGLAGANGYPGSGYGAGGGGSVQVNGGGGTSGGAGAPGVCVIWEFY